jgi:hypothetical protein
MASDCVNRILPLEDLRSDQLGASMAVHTVLSSIFTHWANRTCRTNRTNGALIALTCRQPEDDGSAESEENQRIPSHSFLIFFVI